MHITIVSGSHRPNGESHRIAGWFKQELENQGHQVYHLNLAETELPYWDQGLWGQDGLKEKWGDIWQPIAKQLQQTEAVVCIAPEWGGMVPPKLKNFFLLCSQAEVGHKPGMIVSVSASINGAYPVSELRAHTVKNCKLVWTPEHIIVRNVGQMFLENTADLSDETRKHDEGLRARSRFALQVLLAYASALTPMRQTGKVMDEAYPFGM